MTNGTTVTDLLTIEEAAPLLGIAVTTLYGWRHRQYGPPAVKVGNRVLYRLADIREWIAAQREDGAAQDLPRSSAGRGKSSRSGRERRRT